MKIKAILHGLALNVVSAMYRKLHVRHSKVIFVDCYGIARLQK